jgi:hypothetical protein
VTHWLESVDVGMNNDGQEQAQHDPTEDKGHQEVEKVGQEVEKRVLVGDLEGQGRERMRRVDTKLCFQNVAYANTHIICTQIRVLYILYVCKYAYYMYPYMDSEYDGGKDE